MKGPVFERYGFVSLSILTSRVLVFTYSPVGTGLAPARINREFSRHKQKGQCDDKEILALGISVLLVMGCDVADDDIIDRVEMQESSNENCAPEDDCFYGDDSDEDGTVEIVTSQIPLRTGTTWEEWTPSSGGLEEYAICPQNSVLVGVGATVYHSNVTYLKLKCRYVDANGNLTNSIAYRFSGSGSGFEQYYEVPDGHVIRGLGWNVYHNNVNRLNVWHGYWNSSTMRIEGVTCTSTDNNCANNEVVNTAPDPYPYILTSAVVGVGLNCYNSNMNRMKLDYAVITK